MKLEKGLMTILYEYLKLKKRATRDELRQLAIDNKFDYSTADRKLRRLTEHGFIRPIEGSKRFNAEYVLVEQKNLTTGQIKRKNDVIQDDIDFLREVMKKLIKEGKNEEAIYISKTLISKSKFNISQLKKQYENK